MALRPVVDSMRRGVCTTCAHIQRKYHADKKAESDRDKDKKKPGELWKSFSVEVRTSVEKQFADLRVWKSKQVGTIHTLEIEAQYRRIADEEGWIEDVDGALYKHYKNWIRRQQRKDDKIIE